MKNQYIRYKLDPQKPWTLTLYLSGKRKTVKLTPPEIVHVSNEYCESLPVFNPDAGWNAPYAFKKLTTEEYWTEQGLVPGSVSICGKDGSVFCRGKDFECEENWGSAGRSADGRISENTPVLISYDFCQSRIDSIVQDRKGKIHVICGKPHGIIPKAPYIPSGWKLLINIYYSRHYDRLTEEMIYPVSKKHFSRLPGAGSAETLLPETMDKLRNKKPLKILAWGDSVTACGYIPDSHRWQILFVNALRQKFQHDKIDLVHNGWGGRTSMDFLAEPEGSPYHFESQILNSDADLIISEFVNDCGASAERYVPAYEKILREFRNKGKEWIILTPHWILASWMGKSVKEVRQCKDDPRHFVQFLRTFSQQNKICLADGSAKYAEWAEMGFPYRACMTNGINHPDLRGMKLFAEALLEVFPDK